MAKQTKKKETPNVLLPAMKGIEEVLVRNEQIGLDCRMAGEQLWKQIDTHGVDEIAADEVRAYIFRAASEVQQMMAARKPFTDRLRAACTQFTALENAIDPKKEASPAHRCHRALTAYLKSKRAEAETERKRSKRTSCVRRNVPKAAGVGTKRSAKPPSAAPRSDMLKASVRSRSKRLKSS